MLRWIVPAALAIGCVPEGIRYPNPTDAGPTTDAETDDGGPPDTGPDGGPAGRLLVTANGAPIDQGTTFDFGPIAIGDMRQVSFSIDNGTRSAVSLIGAPLVAISGAGASSFDVAQPSTAFIAPGGSAAFTITATPAAIGEANAAIDIAHGNGAYTFGIRTTGRQPGIWVGVGSNGRRAVSLDGINWSNELTFPGMDDSNLFRSVGFGNGVFVACGGGQNGLLYWSENGIDWNDISDTVGWFGGVAWGNSVFLGVGANGRILTSINGRNWGDGDVDFEQHFRAVAYGNGEFVLVGDGGRRRSTTDGVSFTPSVLGGDRFTAVVFAGDRFIAVGLNGRRAVTLDGETWMFDQTAPDGLGFFDVAYGNNTAVAVGGIGVVVSFDGGENWDQYRDGPLMNAVTFGNGQFVGTGDVNGVSFTSSDGVTWTRHDNVGPAGFTKIAYGE